MALSKKMIFSYLGYSNPMNSVHNHTGVRLNIFTTTVSSNEESMNKLERDVSDCLNFSFEHGELCKSQRQAVISLIYTRDREGRYIKK